MNTLVLGGTAWLSRLFSEFALAGGHSVTCLARGTAGDWPRGAARVVADRHSSHAFDALKGQRFNWVLDVARQPGQVRRSAAALTSICERYAYISSCSVYAQNDAPDQDETAPLLPALAADEMTSMAEYGSAKVACEDAVMRAFGPERSLIVRPGLIGGPGDVSDRSGYWPLRFAKAASQQVLVPDCKGLYAQCIDVRDLANWLLRLCAANTTGTFNACGDSLALETFMHAAQAVAGFKGQTAHASNEWLETQGITAWAGPKSFPLWIPMPDMGGFGCRSIAAAKAHGLTNRPIEAQLCDTLAWELTREQPAARKAGISDKDHAELLALLGKLV